jgi:hypothetical protein
MKHLSIVGIAVSLAGIPLSGGLPTPGCADGALEYDRAGARAGRTTITLDGASIHLHLGEGANVNPLEFDECRAVPR